MPIKDHMDRTNNALISTEMRNPSVMTRCTGKKKIKMDERQSMMYDGYMIVGCVYARLDVTVLLISKFLLSSSYCMCVTLCVSVSNTVMNGFRLGLVERA